MSRESPKRLNSLPKKDVSSISAACLISQPAGRPVVNGLWSAADQIQPLILAQGLYAELGRFGRFGAGIGADHQIIGFLGNRTGDLGAQAFGSRLGFVARHLDECTREDDRLAGDWAIADGDGG